MFMALEEERISHPDHAAAVLLSVNNLLLLCLTYTVFPVHGYILSFMYRLLLLLISIRILLTCSLVCRTLFTAIIVVIVDISISIIDIIVVIIMMIFIRVHVYGMRVCACAGRPCNQKGNESLRPFAVRLLRRAPSSGIHSISMETAHERVLRESSARWRH